MSDSPSSVVKNVLPKLAPVIRAASGLASNDINFYRSLDHNIADSVSDSSTKILGMINSLVSSVESSEINEVDDKSIKESWSALGNFLDTFLEKSDLAFDEIKKGTKKESTQNSMTYLDDSNSLSTSERAPRRMEKPQSKFTIPIDNSESHPFQPLLKSKPHALAPLKEVLQLTEGTEQDPSHYPQPYEKEIMQQDYNEAILSPSEPIKFRDWDSTEAIWVDTVEVLNNMLESLKEATEIAVDLEHHDYRTYYGIVCLMQISTRDQDWLIDTLALRHELHTLNVVFTDPLITKVFHGAFMDIIWLQRDLGLYVVSLFDTYHASKQLGFPKHSLAYLLERFAHFKTSKKYQLADWRIRPLTKPMREYARSDTHFLLYIFDELKNTLIESQKLDKVLFESRNVAVRRFEYTKFKPLINQPNTYSPGERDEPWKRLVYQYNLPMSRSKIVEQLYNWRDQIARQEDESPRYIMPNQLLVSLAQLSPTDPASVLASGNALTEHVRKNCKVIAEIISKCLKDAEREDFELYNDVTADLKPTGEDLSHGDVEKIEAIFDEMDTTVSHSQLFSSSSRLLDGPMLKSNSSENTNQLHERKNLINEKLANVNVLLKIDASDEKVDEPNDEMAADVSNVENTINANAGMFEDTEDIVVLKKKQNNQTGNLADKKRIKQTGAAFDYKAAPNVMAKPTYKKDDKKRKSDHFDPYSKESEGPRPAKKQSRMHQGKTSSFANKKKK